MRPPPSSLPFILSDLIVWGYHYAVIEPAGSRWLPWPGRTSRWWFEIAIVDDIFAARTLAYEDGGSGGGFTLASCIRKASAALDEFAETTI